MTERREAPSPIDVLADAPAHPAAAASPHGAGSPAPSRAMVWIRGKTCAAALGVTVLCTLLALTMLGHFELIDIIMVYLLGTTLAALRLGRSAALLTSFANIAAFDFLFVPPRFSFSVSDPHYVVTFLVMLGVALIIADLVSEVRHQTLSAMQRERRTAALYAMTRELAVTRDEESMAGIAERHIGDAIQVPVRVLLEWGRTRQRGPGERSAGNPAVAEWVSRNQRRAGRDTPHFGGERSIYLPLHAGGVAQGVLLVDVSRRGEALDVEHDRLLENLASQLAQGLERVRLQQESERARLDAERAALRNTLLASISHDLRTPLAALAGAGSMMSEEGFVLDDHRRATLGKLIEDKARDMTELLSNVLELTRLETGPSVLRCDWHSLEDLLGLSLRGNTARLAGWDVAIDVPAGFPMLFVEAGLIVQMLNNLLENCTKHAKGGSKISIDARTVGDGRLAIGIEDDGVGLPARDLERLFEKFERGASEGSIPGVGLGLAICRAGARLHGGDIRVSLTSRGGARFEIELPRTPVPDGPVDSDD